jgi:hypothetical protein
MPIFVCVVRRAQCMICSGMWDLDAGMEPQEACLWCGSSDWQWGPESRDTRFIRQGISRLRKSLNPGATSKKRQDHGRRQWRQFKPKPVDAPKEPAEN